MKIHVISVYLMVIGILFSAVCEARDIERGTIAVSGTTNLVFMDRDYNKLDDRKYHSGHLSTGFFVKDNIEVGLAYSYSKLSFDDRYREKQYGGVFAAWHIDLFYNFNAFVSVFSGYGEKYEVYDSFAKQLLSGENEKYYAAGGEIGVEYFLHPIVAVYMSYTRQWINWHSDTMDYNSDDELAQNMVTGFRLYF